MSEWVERPLGQLADFVMGQSPDSSAVSELEGGLPFLQGCAEFGQQRPEPKFYVDPPLRIAPKGSTLISVRAPVGTMNDADQRYGIGRGIAAVVSRGRSNGFLRYAIELGAPWLHRRSQGSTFLAIGSDDLRKLPIKISEEAGVCETAAAVIAAVDTQIEATETLISKQKRVRAGLMQDLFTRGVDENGQLRPSPEEAPLLYHQTRLGLLPVGWEVRLVGAVTDSVIDGPFGSNLKSEHYVDEPGVRVVRLQNIQTNYYNNSDSAYVSERHARFLAKFTVQPGDVLIASLGDDRYQAGRACCYPSELGPAINKADCFRARPDKSKAVGEFLMLTFNSDRMRRENVKLIQGVTRQRINVGNFKRLAVAMPGLPEQHSVVAAFERASVPLVRLNDELRELYRLKTGLMQDLLTGKVSVVPLLEGAAA